MKRLLSVTMLLFVLASAVSAAADRPNVVWIVSEDNSVHYLRHFFPDGAPAPNIEQLAKSGITFNHAGNHNQVGRCAGTHGFRVILVFDGAGKITGHFLRCRRYKGAARGNEGTVYQEQAD